MPKKEFKLYLYTIFREVFEVSFLTYLIFLILETIKSSFVTYFFDLNILLWVVLVSGIITALTKVTEEKVTVQTSIERLWHYFFRRAGFKKEENFKWDRIFTEIKTKRLLEKGYRFDTEDWILSLKDFYINRWVQRNLKAFYGFRHFGIRERDWYYFKKQLKMTKITSRDFLFIIFISFGGGFLVFYKTTALGYISLGIGLITMVIIFLFSYLIFTEE